MQDKDETKELVKEVSDRARKPILRGKEVLVPLKFDEDGELLTQETFDARKHLKRLSLDDLRFLKAWREAEWNVEKACEKSGYELKKAEKLAKRLQVFREEDAQTKALAEIPTPAWISAKHVENVYNGGQLEDSERDSLKELAKISGAYKTAATVNIQQNVFNLPSLAPEDEARVRALADSLAIETQIVDADAA